MKVSFEGLQNQSVSALDNLVAKINYLKKNDEISEEAYDFLKQPVNALRSCVVTVACLYEQGEHGFTSYFDRNPEATISDLEDNSETEK